MKPLAALQGAHAPGAVPSGPWVLPLVAHGNED